MKATRDRQLGEKAKNHPPILFKDKKSRVWCGDQVIQEHWNKVEKNAKNKAMIHRKTTI